MVTLIPENLEEALRNRAEYRPIPYGGGTDLMVEAKPDTVYLFLHRVKELKKIREDENYIRIGAECTFTEIQEHELTPPLLREAASQIAAPAIRNLGTIGGNVGNGSAKADSALALYALGAVVCVASVNGHRMIPISDFYLGRKTLDINADELITEFLIPKSHVGFYRYRKVGARKALAISRVSFAGVVTWKNDKIDYFSVAFGAVNDVVVTLPALDEIFKGVERSDIDTVGKLYLQEFEKQFVPQNGRISAEYRKTVCRNLLGDFLSAITCCK